MTTDHCVEFPLYLIYLLDQYFDKHPPDDDHDFGGHNWTLPHNVKAIADVHRKKKTRLYESWTDAEGTVHLFEDGA